MRGNGGHCGFRLILNLTIEYPYQNEMSSEAQLRGSSFAISCWRERLCVRFFALILCFNALKKLEKRRDRIGKQRLRT